MAVRIGSLEIFLNVNTSGMGKFGTAARQVEFGSQRMNRALDRTSVSVRRVRTEMGYGWRMRMFGDALRTITRTNDELQRLRGLLVGTAALFGAQITAALGATYLIEAADTYRRINTQLRVVIDSAHDLAAAEATLYEMSMRTRTGYQQTVNFYSRLARSTKQLALSQEDLLRITETVQKTIIIGGATTQEASAAAVQLGQGLASDRLSGDELKSILENAPRLAQAIAEGMGVSIGRLRELGAEGQLTAARITDALLEMSDTVDEQFARVEMTVGQAITNLDSALTRYIGRADESVGITAALAGGINNLAQNFSGVADTLLTVLGAATAIGLGRLGGGAIRGGFNLAVTPGRIVRAEIEQLRDARMMLNRAITESRVDLRRNLQEEARKMQGLTAMFAAGNAQGIMNGQRGLRATREQGDFFRRQIADLEEQRRAIDVQLGKIEGRFNEFRATVGTALGGALSFFGGPIGFGLTAAIAAFGLYQVRAARAAQQTQRVNELLREMGIVSAEAAAGIESLGEAFERNKRFEIQLDIEDFEDVIARTRGNLEAIQSRFETTTQNFGTGNPYFQAQAEIAALIERILEADISQEELNAELSRITEAMPALADVASEVSSLADLLGNATEGAAQLRREIAAIGTAASSLARLRAMFEEWARGRFEQREAVAEYLRLAGRSPEEVAFETEVERARRFFEQAGVSVPERDRLENIAREALRLREEANAVEEADRGGDGGGVSEADRQKEALAAFIEDLRFENDLIGATNQEREIANALREHGAVATDAQRAAIVALIEEKYRELEALERLESAWNAFSSTAQGALSGLIRGLADGVDAMDALRTAALRVSDAILQIQLRSFFDALKPGATGDGGWFGSIFQDVFGGFAGAYAGGGRIPLGQWGIVGERGIEAVRAVPGGAEVIPMAGGGSGGGAPVSQVTVNIATPDIEGFRRARSQVAAEIGRAVDYGLRNR